MSKRPAVTIENYEAVYDYYGDPAYMSRYDGKRRLATHLVHNTIGRLLSPRLTYGEGAQVGVAHMVARNTPALILINHVSKFDPNVVQAGLQRDPGLRTLIDDGRIVAVAKDGLFNARVPGSRTYFESRNLVPAFRPRTHTTDETRPLLFKAANRLNDVLVTHLQRDDSVGLFPEGTRNFEDPKRVLRIGDSAAKVALTAMQAGVDDLSLVTVGVNYGPDNRTRHASVHMEYFGTTELPTTRRDMRTFMQDTMQRALDGAVTAYDTRV